MLYIWYFTMFQILFFVCFISETISFAMMENKVLTNSKVLKHFQQSEQNYKKEIEEILRKVCKLLLLVFKPLFCIKIICLIIDFQSILFCI